MYKNNSQEKCIKSVPMPVPFPAVQAVHTSRGKATALGISIYVLKILSIYIKRP